MRRDKLTPEEKIAANVEALDWKALLQKLVTTVLTLVLSELLKEPEGDA